MKKLLRYSIFLFLTGIIPVGNAQRIDVDAPEPDHTLWIQVETEPNGATLYVLPEKEMAEPTTEIGSTPCIIPVDLIWERGLFAKKWKHLTVYSPGSVCRAVLQPNNDYDLVLSVLAVRNGYKNKRIQQRALVLKYPGKNWLEKKGWPERTTLRIPLEQRKISTRNRRQRLHARKIIVADRKGATGDGASGTVKIHANVSDADIYVDKRYVGVVPMQVILKNGAHRIEIRKQGFYPVQKIIHVNDDDEMTYNARLLPLTP